MKKTLLVITAACFLLSCKKSDKLENEGIFTGAQTEMHHGKTWSWVKVDKDGKPAQVGISLTNAVLNNVPVGNETQSGHHSHSDNLFLDLPAKALEITPFKAIGLDWNPEGHPPVQVYGLPHFDFHFYMMTAAEVNNATDMAKLTKEPAEGYIPANHFNAGPVPQMGTHWIDATSPELHPTNPSRFTQTFIYGSYDGKVNFYEPMATLEYLKATTNFERQIPQPAKFQVSGYYPTIFRIVKEGTLTNIILDGFVYRQAS